MMCVDQIELSYEVCTDCMPWMYICSYKFLEYTHIEVTNTMTSVYTILDYDYRHKNKGTGLVLVPRKCGVYKWDP